MTTGIPVISSIRQISQKNLNDYERGQINTYAKGVNITDQATIDFLNQLNAMNKPVTVIFYGDHLPGIPGCLNRQRQYAGIAPNRLFYLVESGISIGRCKT